MMRLLPVFFNLFVLVNPSVFTCGVSNFAAKLLLFFSPNLCYHTDTCGIFL